MRNESFAIFSHIFFCINPANLYQKNSPSTDAYIYPYIPLPYIFILNSLKEQANEILIQSKTSLKKFKSSISIVDSWIQAIFFCAFIYTRSPSEYCRTIQMPTSPIVMQCSIFSLTMDGKRMSPALKSIPAMQKNILCHDHTHFQVCNVVITADPLSGSLAR